MFIRGSLYTFLSSWSACMGHYYQITQRGGGGLKSAKRESPIIRMAHKGHNITCIPNWIWFNNLFCFCLQVKAAEELATTLPTTASGRRPPRTSAPKSLQPHHRVEPRPCRLRNNNRQPIWTRPSQKLRIGRIDGLQTSKSIFSLLFLVL